jgi:lipopolysaccharide export system permease protein
MILRAYLGRRMHGSIALVLAGFLTLFAFIDLFDAFDQIGRGQYRLIHAFAATALLLPTRLTELLPVALLIGGIWALSQFAQSSEFIAMRAAGLRPARVLLWTVSFGVPWVACAFMVNEWLAPPAAIHSQSLRALGGQSLIDSSERTGNLGSGIWVRDIRRDPEGGQTMQRFINIARVFSDGSLGAVEIIEFDGQRRIKRHLRAASALCGERTGLLLREVLELKWDPYPIDYEHNELFWEGGIDQTVIRLAAGRPERMSALDLWRFVRYLRSNDQIADRHELTLWRRLATPLGGLVMLVLALPFAFLQARSGAMGARILTGVLIGVGSYLLGALLGNLGLVQGWPAPVLAMLPSALLLTLALTVFAVVNRRA